MYGPRNKLIIHPKIIPMMGMNAKAISIRVTITAIIPIAIKRKISETR